MRTSSEQTTTTRLWKQPYANKIDNIERTHSGYDEYRYDLDEINHNPYELAAYLTVKFEDYTREEVQGTLEWLFEQQYELTLTEEK